MTAIWQSIAAWGIRALKFRKSGKKLLRTIKIAKFRVRFAASTCWRQFVETLRSHDSWRRYVTRPVYLEALHIFEPHTRLPANGSVTFLSPPYQKELPDLDIYGPSDLKKPSAAFVPSTYVAKLENCLVSGTSSMIVAGHGSLIVSAEDQILAGNPANFASFLASTADGMYLKPNPRLRTDRSISKGIVISNRFSANYFHFLVEALQNCMLALESVEDSTIPIVTSHISAEFRYLLSILMPGRKIIVIPSSRWYQFDTLYIPVVGAYAPDQAENVLRAGYETKYIPKLQSRIKAAVPAGDAVYRDRHRYRIIYLSRSRINDRGARNVANADEIEQFVQSIGGHVIYPERMPVAEQILMFQQAALIIAPAGAALSNLVFCTSGATCIALHLNRLVNPWYLDALARAAGVKWISVTGPAVGGPLGPHAPYRISIDDLRTAISEHKLLP